MLCWKNKTIHFNICIFQKMAIVEISQSYYNISWDKKEETKNWLYKTSSWYKRDQCIKLCSFIIDLFDNFTARFGWVWRRLESLSVSMENLISPYFQYFAWRYPWVGLFQKAYREIPESFNLREIWASKIAIFSANFRLKSPQ